MGLEGFGAGNVSQGLQLLLQQALGQQVPHKVPQYGPAIRRGVKPGAPGSGRDGAAGWGKSLDGAEPCGAGQSQRAAVPTKGTQQKNPA